MDTLQIRAATLADLDDLCALESLCFSYDQIGRRSFRRLLQRPTAHLYVATELEQLFAYAIILTRHNSRYCRLYSMATSPVARGKGVAKRLLTEIITHLQPRCNGMRLEVKTNNLAGMELYRKLGFEVIDVLPGYYSDGDDGYRMQLTWSDPASNAVFA